MSRVRLAVLALTSSSLACTSAQPAPPVEPAPRAIPYDLPRASDFAAPSPASDAPAAKPAPLVFAIEITRDDAIGIDGHPLADDAELLRAARAAKARDADVRAIIRADQRASWGRVVHVIDLLKQGGIAKYAFAVTPMGAR